MKPLQLAEKYLEIFYRGKSVDALQELLAPDLLFKGPYHEFDSAVSYIAALKSDPPEGLQYRILKAYEDESSACLIYEFSKPGVSTVMSQTFEIEGGKIAKILLIFDTAAFV